MLPRLLKKLSPPYPTFAHPQQRLCENGSVDTEDFHLSEWTNIEIRRPDVWIVLMGVNGSGKSSFVSQVVEGVAATADSSLKSCAVEPKCYSFKHHSGRTIHLIDTPGSYCLKLRDREMLSDIFASLAQAYGQPFKLNGIIYLHRITDPHLGGPGLDCTNWFKRICGNGAFRNVVLATTMWTDQHGRPNVPHDVAVQRENLLTENDRSWGIMRNMGSRVVRHTPDKASAMDIVEGLMSLQPLTFTLEEKRKE